MKECEKQKKRPWNRDYGQWGRYRPIDYIVLHCSTYVLSNFRFRKRPLKMKCLQKTVVGEQWRRLEFRGSRESVAFDQPVASVITVINNKSSETLHRMKWWMTNQKMTTMINVQLQLNRKEFLAPQEDPRPQTKGPLAAAMASIYEFENIKNLYNLIGSIHFGLAPSFSSTGNCL